MNEIERATRRPVRDERGMTTAEYAVATLGVVTVVALIMTLAQGGEDSFFGGLIKDLVSAMFARIGGFFE